MAVARAGPTGPRPEAQKFRGRKFVEIIISRLKQPKGSPLNVILQLEKKKIPLRGEYTWITPFEHLLLCRAFFGKGPGAYSTT